MSYQQLKMQLGTVVTAKPTKHADKARTVDIAEPSKITVPRTLLEPTCLLIMWVIALTFLFMNILNGNYQGLPLLKDNFIFQLMAAWAGICVTYIFVQEIKFLYGLLAKEVEIYIDKNHVIVHRVSLLGKSERIQLPTSEAFFWEKMGRLFVKDAYDNRHVINTISNDNKDALYAELKEKMARHGAPISIGSR
ncbi:hypothetical protein [Pseudoalteromonas luteoviolacea]|uniref:hypothetical protein n=1 Tax=Pseudoalteromonas luteoviolacea TaxID=43657 RepID=UPI001F3A97CB|nr:hypothetical protein [Pseudoalteromonas luteoviolacea]